jgi:5-(carboxyamino)imidazole ribonucleotide mutase
MNIDVGIIMGSRSDWETMRHASDTLEALGVSCEVRVVSAHRTPDLLFEYAASAVERGLKIIIAGAGGAAHLPGMTAAKTRLPVLGVPVRSEALSGMDSLLSIAQMPAGIPVGSMAIGRAGAINAAPSTPIARSRLTKFWLTAIPQNNDDAHWHYRRRATRPDAAISAPSAVSWIRRSRRPPVYAATLSSDRLTTRRHWPSWPQTATLLPTNLKTSPSMRCSK